MKPLLIFLTNNLNTMHQTMFQPTNEINQTFHQTSTENYLVYLNFDVVCDGQSTYRTCFKIPICKNTYMTARNSVN